MAVGGASQSVGAQRHPTVASSVETRGRTDAAETLLRKHITINVRDVSVRNAVDAIGAAAGIQIIYQSATLDNVAGRVTLQRRDIPFGEALKLALAGTALRIVPLPEAQVAVDEGDDGVSGLHRSAVPTGSIAGRITDATTGKPVAKVTITIDDASRGVVSSEDGTYIMPGVAAGTHRVTARMIGYRKKVVTTTVTSGETVTANVTIDPSTNTLEQIIVTGTVVPTELKAIPNAMTVITGKELERRGITHIDQLFRGDVPGVFAQNQGSLGVVPGLVRMSSRGSTALDDALSQSIKTYVDGVELADPSYLGLIDPRSIERIEILTGPQASTIYGSGAISGVMQVFTKRGTTTRPQLVATLQSGLIENNSSSARTPIHDDNVQLSGLSGQISYNIGGSWNYTGPWTPAVHNTSLSGFGGVRLQQGPITLDVSLRRVLGTNWNHGRSQQGIVNGIATGDFSSSGLGVIVGDETFTSHDQTLGTTLTYNPFPWWSQTVTVGSDVLESGDMLNTPGYTYPGDTLAQLTQETTTRTSVSYTTTASIPFSSFANANVSAGVDGWHSLSTSIFSQSTSLTGSLNGTSQVSRLPDHNRGMFLQGQFGVADMLFLTYGIRAEWNPTYGNQVNPNVVPRYGIALTQTFGDLTMKARASLGHSTRPPTSNLTEAIQAPGYLVRYFGYFDRRLANPDLLPEQQQGGEGGLEMYFGTRASLVVTRYNQTVDNLILQPIVDSVRSLKFDPLGRCGFDPDYCRYLYTSQTKNLNIGSVRNQGWELQGTVTTGPVTTKGTYSWTKSRVLGITPAYRRLFPQYVPGAVFQGAPEHTYALSVQYAVASNTVSLDLQGQGKVYGSFDFSPLGTSIVYRRLDAVGPRHDLPSPFIGANPSYVMADLNAAHRLASYVDGTLQIQNLSNYYRPDAGAYSTVIGRQSKLGLRIRW